ncbi:VOC family protein [Paenibacillus filicis]|uniref:VOC family protein n=1 Tax=Paenibacillus filicis TaxID=669464 RepID=A0ABU9DI69_9BACL
MSLQFTPFIMLDGHAREAIRFYEEALGAQVVFCQTIGEAPDDAESSLSEEAKARIAHSVLLIDGAQLFVSDVLPGQKVQPGNLLNICITADNEQTSRRFYDALLQGGQVHIPLGPIYFSPAYGMVTDKFGVVFQLFTRRATE